MDNTNTLEAPDMPGNRIQLKYARERTLRIVVTSNLYNN